MLVRDYSDPNHAKWERAVVEKVLGRRNYLVTLIKSSRQIKRHVDQMVKDSSVVNSGEMILPKRGNSTDVSLRPPSSRSVGSYSAKIVLASETITLTQPEVEQPGLSEVSQLGVGSQDRQELDEEIDQEAVRGFDTGWSIQGRKRKVKEVFPDPYARKTSKRLKTSKYDQLLRTFLPLQNSAFEASEYTSNGWNRTEKNN